MGEKREFTADQLRELEDSGMTMPGGGYPIETVGDLRNAIQAIGRAKDRGATIKHIIRQARRLERADLVPEDWFAEVGDSTKSAKSDLVDVPQWIADNAKQGLKWRDDTNYRGGVMDYVIREAQDMADGKVTVDKAKRMYAWFARHMVDLDSPSADPDSEDYPSPGVVAHALWGGRNREDSKRAMEWAKKIRDQYEGEDEKQETDAVEWKSTGVVEHKTVPVSGVKVLDEQSGLVETIVSVTGIVDRVKDVIEPGAYQKTLAERTPKGVWGHDWNTPISRTEEVVELMPGDHRLPSIDRKGDAWPKDAGALLVRTRFNLETQRGREAFSDVKFFGDQQEWSIGYNVPVGGAKVESKTGIRRIQSLDLFEYSPVLFGAMPEAVTQSVKTAQTALKAVRAVEMVEHEVIDEVAKWFEDARDEIEAEIAEFEAARAAEASEPEEDDEADGFDEVSIDEGDLVPAIAQEKGVPGRGNAETLRRYWAEGEGAAKIRWGTEGDFDRCVRAVNQYMPGQAEGYCNLLHHRALGIWPAQHAGIAKSDAAQAEIEQKMKLVGEREIPGFGSDDEEEPKVYKPGAASILRQIADKLENDGVDDALLRSAMSAIERLMDAQPMEEDTEQKAEGCAKPPCSNYDPEAMSCKVCGYSEKEDITPYVMRAEILALELDAEEKSVQEPQKHGGWIWQGNPAGGAGSPSMPDAPDVPGLADPKAPSSSAGGPDTKVRDAKDFSVGGAAGELKKISREGRPDASGTEADPIDVGDDVELAHKLLSEGKHVRMKDEMAVSTLLDKLHETVKDAEAKGESAPEYDLCKVSVPGTNLFCVESKGIPRVKMPQFKGTPVPGSFADTRKNSKGEGDVEPEFRELLAELGISTEIKTVKANELRASQDNLDGVKVTGMAQAMREGKIPDAPIFVTKDGYILDGHHRWAAKVATDLDDGKSGDMEMPVEVIDAEIGYLIDLANGFTEMAGIKPKGLGASADSVDAKPGDESSDKPKPTADTMIDRILADAGVSRESLGSPTTPAVDEPVSSRPAWMSQETEDTMVGRVLEDAGIEDYSSMGDADLMDLVRQNDRAGFESTEGTRATAEALRRGLLDDDIEAQRGRTLADRQMDEGIRNIEESGDYTPMADDVMNGRYKLMEAAQQVARWIDGDPEFVQSNEMNTRLDEITADRESGEQATIDNLTAGEAMDLSRWARQRGKTGLADFLQEWAMQESDRDGSMETPFGQPAPSTGRMSSSSPFEAAYAAAYEFGMDDYDPNAPSIDAIIEDFRSQYPNPTALQLQELVRDLEDVGANASADAVRRWIERMGAKSDSAELTKELVDYMRMVAQ